MAQQSAVPVPVLQRRENLAESDLKNEANLSAVSWGAVAGGAFVSASLALILLALGSGLGFSAVSPWSNFGVSASTIGKGAIAWLIVTQILASAFGGYLAGRLRTKWTNTHNDEVYFRDTAHGLLVWAVGMVITAAFLASAVTSLLGRTSDRSSDVPQISTETASLTRNDYYVDALLRSTNADHNDAAAHAEVGRIFSHSLLRGELSGGDQQYLEQLVAAKTGLDGPHAETRVTTIFQEAQDDAERARKALAHLSLWLFVALLSGAFCASFAGTIGGRQRDRVAG